MGLRVFREWTAEGCPAPDLLLPEENNFNTNWIRCTVRVLFRDSLVYFHPVAFCQLDGLPVGMTRHSTGDREKPLSRMKSYSPEVKKVSTTPMQLDLQIRAYEKFRRMC